MTKWQKVLNVSELGSPGGGRDVHSGSSEDSGFFLAGVPKGQP